MQLTRQAKNTAYIVLGVLAFSIVVAMLVINITYTSPTTPYSPPQRQYMPQADYFETPAQSPPAAAVEPPMKEAHLHTEECDHVDILEPLAVHQEPVNSGRFPIIPLIIAIVAVVGLGMGVRYAVPYIRERYFAYDEAEPEPEPEASMNPGDEWKFTKPDNEWAIMPAVTYDDDAPNQTLAMGYDYAAAVPVGTDGETRQELCTKLIELATKANLQIELIKEKGIEAHHELLIREVYEDYTVVGDFPDDDDYLLDEIGRIAEENNLRIPLIAEYMNAQNISADAAHDDAADFLDNTTDSFIVCVADTLRMMEQRDFVYIPKRQSDEQDLTYIHRTQFLNAILGILPGKHSKDSIIKDLRQRGILANVENSDNHIYSGCRQRIIMIPTEQFNRLVGMAS